MPTIIRCPACQKALRVRDGLEGTRVQCPDCKHRWVVPGAEEPEEAQAGIQREEDRPVRRPRPEPEEEDEPPRPRRSRRDEDEEEEDRPRRPRKRRRPPPEDHYSPSMAPMVFGILSIVFSCIPILGIGLGYVARNKADEEMMRVPDSRYSRGAFRQMEMAKILGGIGIGLSCAMIVLGCILRIKAIK